MKMRSLCESPGALNAADNGAYDGVFATPYSEATTPLATTAPGGGMLIGSKTPYDPYKTPLATINDYPFNPGSVGIIPIHRNEADSDIEIQKQTPLWQKGTKIAASMLQFFPGAGYMATAGQTPAAFIIPEAKKVKPPLKTGLLGTILAPPEAINVIRKDEVEEPKEPGFWSKYFDAYAQAGATSTAAGGVDFIKTKGVEKAKSTSSCLRWSPGIRP